MNYVLGFMFSPTMRQVILIRKTKPEWQAGKWNGVGGKVEINEMAFDAMVREFKEETGLSTRPSEWLYVASAPIDGGKIFIFAARSVDFLCARTTTDEEINNWITADLNTQTHCEEVIPNLLWIIPMCQGALGIPKEFQPANSIHLTGL